jgi:hypothetical protein
MSQAVISRNIFVPNILFGITLWQKQVQLF